MFGMGFSEIIIILIIAILFLGPDKLPTAMVDIAKFFRNMKRTIGEVKDTIEEEMSVSEIKQEALEYKKELLNAQSKVSSVTDLSNIDDKIDSLLDDDKDNKKDETNKKERVTFNV